MNPYKVTQGIFLALIIASTSGCASLEERVNLVLIDRAIRQPSERVDVLSAEPTKPFKIIGYITIRELPEYEPQIIQVFMKKAAQAGADALILSKPKLGQISNEDLIPVGAGFDQSFNQSYKLSAAAAAAAAAAEEKRKVVFRATMITYGSPDKS